jgi:GNAT superfamily N-acetyltransferase
MLRFLRRLFREPHPLDPDVVGDRARDITFRVMQDEDVPICLSLYRANEAAHFPPGRFEYYESRLRSRQFLTLIACRGDEPVGCSGIQYDADGVAVLCFGMVSPSHHRRGIGTAQLLVCLALVTPIDDIATVAMFAIPGSVSFYRRFGFVFLRHAQGDDGSTYPLGVLRFNQTVIDDCRTLLASRRIAYPDVRDSIPQRRVA